MALHHEDESISYILDPRASDPEWRQEGFDVRDAEVEPLLYGWCLCYERVERLEIPYVNAWRHQLCYTFWKGPTTNAAFPNSALDLFLGYRVRVQHMMSTRSKYGRSPSTGQPEVTFRQQLTRIPYSHLWDWVRGYKVVWLDTRLLHIRHGSVLNAEGDLDFDINNITLLGKQRLGGVLHIQYIDLDARMCIREPWR